MLSCGHRRLEMPVYGVKATVDFGMCDACFNDFLRDFLAHQEWLEKASAQLDKISKRNAA